ncbi:unnamed protein product [Orchesella dallaii]|uniref:Uncharacterized protein n=1 Tax=Orchesella dallaii TaxID=48710 RepID=A0ABP1SAJ8_9HEXA
MESLLQKFGLSASDQNLVEKTESIILRVSPTRYVRKQQSRFVDTTGSQQLFKLEIQIAGRVAKACTVYLDANSKIYKAAEDVYDAVLDNCLVDITPTSVNQYRKT